MSSRPPRLSNRRLGYVFWWIAAFFTFSSITAVSDLDLENEAGVLQATTLGTLFGLIAVAFIISGTILFIAKEVDQIMNPIELDPQTVHSDDSDPDLYPDEVDANR